MASPVITRRPKVKKQAASNLIVVVSDVQWPYHHPVALRNVIKFIGDIQPSEVIQIGDLMDYPQPSRWNAGTRGEFKGGVIKDSGSAKRGMLKPLRDAYDGKVTVIEGNHDLRPREYFERNNPALDPDEENPYTLDKLLDFDGFGIDFVRRFYNFAPGWVATHLHLGFSLSRYAGGTAMNAARKMRKSVVGGHTHRLGLIAESSGYEGRGETVWGFEVGHLMDVRKAAYLKHGYGNWQSGIGVFEVDGNLVRPIPVPITPGGAFSFRGTRYGVSRSKSARI